MESKVGQAQHLADVSGSGGMTGFQLRGDGVPVRSVFCCSALQLSPFGNGFGGLGLPLAK